MWNPHCGYKGLDIFFCRNNYWKRDKELTVPKWVLIVRSKILQMPQNLSAQFVYLSPKVLDFNEKRLHWASVVHSWFDHIGALCWKYYLPSNVSPIKCIFCFILILKGLLPRLSEELNLWISFQNTSWKNHT
jgi:hypothetical protein